VPEKRQELTTEGGLDVAHLGDRIEKVIAKVVAQGIRVSLFIDPEERQVLAAGKVGAHMIEIHTGAYSEAKNDEAVAGELQKVIFAAQKGKELNLGVNAGHGLHYHNVRPIAGIPEIDELSIGHSIIARALFTGLGQAVRDMLALI